MATPASQTVSSTPNPSAQGSPRTRDWGNLKTGDTASAFRGIGRGRGSRGGGVRSGRGGGNPPNTSGQKGSNLPETAISTPSPSTKASSVPRKHPVPPSVTVTTNVEGKSVNGVAECGGRPKPGSRKQPRTPAPPSPLEAPQTAPPTPSRSANRRRHSQQGKGVTTTAKPPPPNAAKSQKSRGGSTPASQTILRKDVPPHLAAAHEAEIRHDIDALVERVRAVAMAENRPTTPGSHIDWAGDEDDSLPDLDDWGITTTHTNATHGKDESEEISPILADALKPLPEPNSDVQQEEEREVETYDEQPSRAKESSAQPSLPGPTEAAATVPSIAERALTAAQESSSPTLPDGKPSLHPSLPPKPVAAMESLRARGKSDSRPSSLPQKPSVAVVEEEQEPSAKITEGLTESIHAPSVDEYPKLEMSSASSSERSLAASIHAAVCLPESHSAPNLLTGVPSSVPPRTHSRSQTEGRPRGQPHTVPASHRHGRSGASSPLGKHVFTHSRNHSTPAGSSRLPQTVRPVITGEAISRLARTIGGLGPTPRTQAVPITKDSTISS